MSETPLPKNFLRFNTEQSKNLAVVVEIAGLELLTNRDLFTRIRYGDPEIFYGDDGLYYGGLRKLGGVLPILDLDKASMTIAQRLEPEQGKGAIQQIALSFIDLDGYMTQACARDQIIPDILGSDTRIWIGYAETSYPDDYFIVFRGVVTGVESEPGAITLQFSDANVKRRQQICYTPQIALSAALTPTTTTIPILTNTNFYQPILGPDGTYDVNGPWNTDGTHNAFANRRNGVRTFVVIDNEYIEYGPLGFLTVPKNQIQNIEFTSTSSKSSGIVVNYIGGGTAGAEIVNVVTATITVTIQSGVSTVNNIIAAMTASAPASALVTSTKYKGILNIQNIDFLIGNPAINDPAITFTSGAPSPVPVITVTGNTSIAIQIQSGITTALQILNAVESTPSIAALGITISLNPPTSGLNPQTAPAGPVTIGALAQTAPGGPVIVDLGFVDCLRGAKGTVADNHDVDATVSSAVQFTESAMILALKLMLSGWNGNWISGVKLFSIVYTTDPILANQNGAVVLPTNIDAQRDYGLVPGDYVTISGSATPGNNITSTIVRFGSLNGQLNRIIYLKNQTLYPELPTDATLAFRSQFDTYPVLCGVALPQYDVDVQGHLDVYNNWLNDPGDFYQFFIKQSIDNLKQFIETNIYLPVACYSVTRRGQLSASITRPPLVQGAILFLTQDNILEPQTIKISRYATSNRKFYNEIDYTFDYDDSGNPHTNQDFLNVDSLSIIGISSILPIDGLGVKTSLGSAPLLANRANNLLTRYKYGASIIDLKVNWEYGVQIEAGDIVALSDLGNLQISNFDVGVRDLGTALYEVVNRSLDIKQANCVLQLISGLGLSATDRYGVVSPSSNVVSGSPSELIIEDSFGAQYPGNEMEKWLNFAGQPIVLHDADYTQSFSTTITGFDPANNYRMFISGFTGSPPADYSVLIIDIPNYPQSPKKLLQSTYKNMFAYFSPTVLVVSGASETQFDVGPGDIGKFFVKGFVRVSSYDYNVWSGDKEFQITQIVGNSIVLKTALPFIPIAGEIVTSIGFPDSTGTYRLI